MWCLQCAKSCLTHFVDVFSFKGDCERKAIPIVLSSFFLLLGQGLEAQGDYYVRFQGREGCVSEQFWAWC